MPETSSIARREFIRTVAAGAVTAASLRASAWAAPADSGRAAGSRPPNIVVIMSDEHNVSVLGAYGNKIVRTPHLDGLAARGVTFDAAYTNSPLCAPCRASFTAGKYISRVSAWSNNSWLPSDAMPSLPRILNDAGYVTALCGKMHYDRTRRYGFQQELAGGNNSFKTGLGKRRAADDLAPTGLSARFKEFRVSDKESGKTHDTAVKNAAIPFIRQQKRDGQPFFLFVGFIAPHFPLIMSEAAWKVYENKVPMPTIPPGHLESLPLNYKHLRVGFRNENVPPETVKLGRELYYALTEWLDAQIGEVLAALGDSEVADNTVVIYTTDHGENLGEHGLWWKNAVYDSAARVPLIVSWPARWAGGQRRTGACSLVDVVQTIAQLAGAKTPDDWDGESLVAWLDDPKAPWRDIAVSQYYAHNIASGYAMIRQGKFKYVYHSAPDDKHPAEEELYDLSADPGEFNNLAKHPEQRARCEAMLAALCREIGEHPNDTEKRARAEQAVGYQRQAKSAAPQAMRNRRFENELNFWELKQGTERYSVVKGAGREGSVGLKYAKARDDAGAKENAHIEQSLNVEPGAQYVFGGWVKAEGDLRPIIRIADAASKTVALAVAGESRDWQKIEATFDAGKNSSIRFQIFGGSRGGEHETAPGVSYFDDVYLDKTTADEDED